MEQLLLEFMNPLEIRIKEAGSGDLDDILSLINTLNKEWYKPIIPDEHYKEPFLTREQIDQMSAIMTFWPPVSAISGMIGARRPASAR